MAREMKDSGIEWVGDIPASWKINTVFQLFTQVKNKNTDLQEQNLLSLSYGKIKRRSIDTTDGLLPESFDGYNIIEADDIVLRLTDLQNDHKSLRVGLATERGIVTSAYLTVRNRSESLAKYLYYYLHSFDIAKGFYGMGAGVRQGLNWDGMKWLKILTPSVPEQQRIVSFLDTECGRIDAVIEKTRTSIEEYKKLKQAVITHAVTKGIRSDRPMKDSETDFYGVIPESWDCCKLKYLISSLNSGTSVTATELKEDGYPVFGGGQRIGYFSQFNMEDTLVIGRVGARCGCITKVEGKAWATDNALIVTTTIPMDYLYYVLLAAELNKLNTSNAQPLITSSKVLNYKVPLCWDQAEQNEITAYLDKKCRELDVLIEKKERFALELEKLKKAVIFEYVTGKREVSNANHSA